MMLAHAYKASSSKVYEINGSNSKLDVWVSLARRRHLLGLCVWNEPLLTTSLLLLLIFQDVEEKDSNREMRGGIVGHFETDSITGELKGKGKRFF